MVYVIINMIMITTLTAKNVHVQGFCAFTRVDF